MTAIEMRKWIGQASYEDLLRKSRFSPKGDPMFTGYTGELFAETMAMHRRRMSALQCAEISERVGFEGMLASETLDTSPETVNSEEK